MARYRYKGTDQVEVRALRLIVNPEDVVEIPDHLVWVEDAENDPRALVWPDELWQDTEAPKGRSKPKAADKPDPAGAAAPAGTSKEGE